MRYQICSYLALALVLVLTSCSNKQYQYLFQQKNTNADSLAKNSAVSTENYRIKPQDILQIRNLQNISYLVSEAPVISGIGGSGTAATQTFQVEDDGTVALPVIGHLKVSGFTRAEAAKQIEDLYRKNLLKDPIIELKIVNLKITILGEIRVQGNFTLTKDRTTLVEMIGEAGGLTEKANETDIKIIRGTQANPQVTEINLRNLNSINDPRAILQSGDIVYVGQNKRSVRTDNLQNFSSIMQPALLLFNTALIIFTLAHR